MRIACIYLPSFPLQAHVRRAPHLAGVALAIVEPRPAGASILTCTRAAWSGGARPGMAVPVARAACPDLQVATVDRGLYRHTLQAVIESLGALCDVVDAGSDLDAPMPHRAIYVQVPPRSRGASFGHKLIAQLSRQGLRCRVGVADDRFTAYTAAVQGDRHSRPQRPSDRDGEARSAGEPDGRIAAKRSGTPGLPDSNDGRPPLFQQSCTVVPRAGGAAFLAPLALSNLPIDPDIRHLLETCGVETLGDFADLPPPSLARDRIAPENDYQALARGQGPTALCSSQPDEGGIVERIELEHEIADYQPLSFILPTLCERVGHRLDGRARAAGAVQLYLSRAGQGTAADQGSEEGSESDDRSARADAGTAITVPLSRPAMSSRELLDAIRARLQESGLPHAVVALELEVTAEAEPAEAELSLFEAPRSAQASAEAPTGPTGLSSYPGKTAPIAHQRPPGPRPERRSHGRQQVLHLFEQ